MPIRWNKFLFILFFLAVTVSFSQEKNPTVYPYGGVPDSNRFDSFFMEKIPLNFFYLVKFDSAHFDNQADFDGAQFHSLADFEVAQFNKLADFGGAQFHDIVYFKETKFDNYADFRGAKFDSRAYFMDTKFDSLADFGGAKFHNLAVFADAKFDSLANFGGAKFYNLAYFVSVESRNKIDFNSAVFNSKIEFRAAYIDSVVDFSLAEIKDTVLVGIPKSSELQNYDFMRAKLLEAGIDTIEADSAEGIPQNIFQYPGAKILLYGPVDLKIQLEKFKFIALYDKLDYYSKKDIISTLKQVSFKGDEYQKERFELDYILAKSTMYQKRSPNYQRYSAFNPISWGQFLYNITIGLGYRPFRLAWWVLGFIILFTFVYYFWMPGQINTYIAKGDQRKATSISRQKRTRQTANPHFTDTILNCFYFSSMMFFTFRLKRDILTFFSTKEKRVVVGEWLIGLIIYISFLTLSKSGSILHTLKSLFVG